MSLLHVLLGNAASATVLCALVALAALRIRRPRLLHALWLAVLLDLVAPPIVQVDLLPDWSTPGVAQDAQRMSSLAIPAPQPRDAVPLGSLAVLLWCVGSLSVLGLAIHRGIRLARALGSSEERFPALEVVLARHAARMGCGRAPRLRVVAARISPLVLPRFAGSEIVVPRGLVESLEPREIEAILVHELAHVRRRDSWVRLVELAATIAFWWHPVVYAARAALRRAEESCCDERVLDQLPGHATDYALGLVKTLEYLSPARERQPVWATGAAPAPAIERRLNMILDRKTSARLPRPMQLGLALLIVAALVVFPASGGRAEQGDEQRSAATAATSASERAELERARRELELERTAIERARTELEQALASEPSRALAEAERARISDQARMERTRAAGGEGLESALVRAELLRAELETARVRESDDPAARLELARTLFERARIEDQARAELDAARAGRSDDPAASAERARVVKQVLGEVEHARSAEASTTVLARQNEELRVQVEQLRRRVQELERRMAGGSSAK